MILIFIQYNGRGSKTFPLKIEETIRVSDLKKIIAKEIEIDQYEQWLEYKTKKLEDGCRLKDYDIMEHATIRVISRDRGVVKSCADSNEQSPEASDTTRGTVEKNNESKLESIDSIYESEKRSYTKLNVFGEETDGSIESDELEIEAYDSFDYEGPFGPESHGEVNPSKLRELKRSRLKRNKKIVQDTNLIVKKEPSEL